MRDMVLNNTSVTSEIYTFRWSGNSKDDVTKCLSESLEMAMEGSG